MIWWNASELIILINYLKVNIVSLFIFILFILSFCLICDKKFWQYWIDVRSHIALLFTSGFIPLRLRETAKSSAAAEETGRMRRIRTRVRSLKPSRGNAKHVTVLKESERSAVRRAHKACSVRCKARAHVPSNLLFRYSLVAVSSTVPLLFSGLSSCIPNPMPLSFSTAIPRNRRVEWSPSDIRYSIIGDRISLCINPELSFSSFPYWQTPI